MLPLATMSQYVDRPSHAPVLCFDELCTRTDNEILIRLSSSDHTH
jgi:hypothetical protein